MVFDLVSFCTQWCLCVYIFFFKQKTAYEVRISDWSSDVCSSDLAILVFEQFADRTHTAVAKIVDVVDLALAILQVHQLLDHGEDVLAAQRRHREIGRASCRERVCQYV